MLQLRRGKCYLGIHLEPQQISIENTRSDNEECRNLQRRRVIQSSLNRR